MSSASTGEGGFSGWGKAEGDRGVEWGRRRVVPRGRVAQGSGKSQESADAGFKLPPLGHAALIQVSGLDLRLLFCRHRSKQPIRLLVAYHGHERPLALR